MTGTDDRIPTIGEAVSLYVMKLPAADRDIGQLVLFKLSRWAGQTMEFSKLSPPVVAGYAEQISTADTDYQKKLEVLRAFFSHAKKSGWSTTNLGTHVKTRKPKGRKATNPAAKQETVYLSRERHAEMVAELALLKDRSRELVGEIQRAAADKDFRENAPLQAAKEERGYVEGRIRKLEDSLKIATIIEEKKAPSTKSTVGDCLLLCDLESGEECRYTIVDPREVDAVKGKISIVSPLGRALLGKRDGDTVEVKAPAGKLRFQIKRIER